MAVDNEIITFYEHPSFSRNLEKFNKKHDNGLGFRHLKKLLSLHFDPSAKSPILTPKVLKRVDRLGSNIEVYKVTMHVKGLPCGLCPRICFQRLGNQLIFLCFGTHIENYKDNELKEEIKQRIKEIYPETEF